jgi:hypothetical protein
MASRYAARVFRGGARLRERGWGADAHAAERRPFAWCAASISVRDSALVIPMESDCASVVADIRDLAVALV